MSAPPIIYNGDSAKLLKPNLKLNQQTSTPSTPEVGSDLLYFKSDDKLYAKNSSGIETLVGPSAGSGIASINSDSTAAQSITTGTTGSDFNISNPGSGSHVLNLPLASASNTGKLSSADWSTFNSKLSSFTETDPLSIHLDGSNSPTSSISWNNQNLTHVGTLTAGPAVTSGNTIVLIPDTGNGTVEIQTNSFGNGFWLNTNVANGTSGSPTAVTNGLNLLNISIGGYDGTTPLHPALINGVVNGTVSSGIIPVDLGLNTMMVDGVFSSLTLAAAGSLNYVAGASGGPANFTIQGGSGALNTIHGINGSGLNLIGSDQSAANLYLTSTSHSNKGQIQLGSNLQISDAGNLVETFTNSGAGELWSIHGTLGSGGNAGFHFTTGANSAVNSQGLISSLSGSNGNRYHYAILGQTSTTGTGNDLFNGFGNVGLSGAAFGTTTGLNIGQAGAATSGAKSVGLWGGAPGFFNTQTANSTYVGVLATALNTQSGSFYIGSHVLLTGPTGSAAYSPPSVNVGLLVDNAASGADLQYWYNNGSQVGKVDNLGNFTLGSSTSNTHRLNSAIQTPSTGSLTLTNGPGASSGNPAVYLTLNINGVNYVIPAWTF